MKHLVSLALLAIFTATPVTAQEITDATVARIKDATVYVKIEQGPSRQAFGSGFLVRKIGKIGYIATNEHVILPVVREAATLKVVFYSGTPREKEMDATVVGRDDDNDLAILKVESLALPNPINPAFAAPLRETLPVYIFGFPFGPALSMSEKSPAITVGRGSVSSIRLNETNQVGLIQIDGDINPGNSGGPIVTARGELVGVSVAKVLGTHIGLAIPAAYVGDAFSGRVRRIYFTTVESSGGKVRLLADVKLIDPLNTIKSVSVLMIPADQVPAKPKVDSKPVTAALPIAPISPRMREYPLRIDKDSATAEIVLEGTPDKDVTYTFQTKWAKADRRNVIMPPKELRVEFSRQQAALDGAAPSSQPALTDIRAERQKLKDTGWLGSGGKDSRALKAFQALEPYETGESLLNSDGRMVDARVVGMKLPQGVCWPEWSGDGQFVYLLEEHGLLRKIKVPEMREERRFEIAFPCSHLRRSRAGLVVSVGKLNELWVFDEKSLQLVQRAAMPSFVHMATSPGSDYAFVGSGPEHLGVAVVDLRSGRIVSRFGARRPGPARPAGEAKDLQFIGTSGLWLTQDGLNLVVQDSRHVYRFSIRGSEAKLEQQVERTPGSQAVWLSTDSKRLILARDERTAPAGKPSRQGLYIVSLEDLEKDLEKVSIQQEIACFDGQHGRIYYYSGGSEVLVYSERSGSAKKYPSQRPIYVSPDGQHLLSFQSGQAFWVELPAEAATSAPAELKPVLVGKPMLGSPWQAEVGTITPVLPGTGKILPCVRWSADGAAVFVLDPEGTVHRLSVPAFVEERRLEIQRRCSWMDISREGLLVVIEDLQEIWVVNESDLALRKKIVVTDVHRVASSAALTTAYAIAREPNRLMVVDLASGRMLEPIDGRTLQQEAGKKVRRPDDPGISLDFGAPAVSPDGKFLFTGRYGSLHRLAIQGTSLVYEEASPVISGTDVQISPDSAYVARPGNAPVAGYPLVQGMRTYVYRVNDLQMPALIAPDIGHILGFDPKAGKIYGTGETGKLLIFGPDTGTEVKKTSIQDNAQQILVHPAGARLLWVGEKQVYWVEPGKVTAGLEDRDSVRARQRREPGTGGRRGAIRR